MTDERHEEPKVPESALSPDVQDDEAPRRPRQELDVPPNVRTLINSRRRVIE